MQSVRKSVSRSGIIRDDEFKWRGGEVSRVEGFSDAVFAFAVTLLVVSLEVPSSFDALLATMTGFAAFAICFAMLVFIWYHHYTYFRRYGLEDPFTITLNAVLMFVVLMYIYPLKFLFSFLTQAMTGYEGPGQISILSADVPMLMIVYSSGLFVIFGIFALLNWHAWRLRDSLRLNDIEKLHTTLTIQAHIIYSAVSFISVMLSVVGGQQLAPYSGLIYALFGPIRAVHGIWFGKKFKALEEKSNGKSNAKD